MARYRNLGPNPLDLHDGRQVFVGDDVDLTKADLEQPQVAAHLKQGTLAPVTLATTAASAGSATS